MPLYYHGSQAQLAPGTQLKSNLKRADSRYSILRQVYLHNLSQLEGMLLTEWVVNTKIPNQGWPIWGWTKEVIYEAVRETAFPNLPGRFESVFLYETQDIAIQFLKTYRGGKGAVYECVSDSDLSYRLFDQTYWNNGILHFGQTILPQIERIKYEAHAYYSQSSTDSPLYEVLSPTPITVRRKIVNLS